MFYKSKKMKKIFLNVVLLIIIGNIIIMFLENYCYGAKDMNQLHIDLLNTNMNESDAILKVPTLLLIKIKIWLATFSILSVILFLIAPDNKKLIRNFVMLFYTIGCLANVLIIPHPTWLLVALIPIIVVPFIVVENFCVELIKLLKEINSKSKTSNSSRIELSKY